VPADLELVTAWQDGALIFRMTPLASVVEEVNRYRPGRVVLIDRRLAELPVSGRFRIDHIDEIIVRLGQSLGLTSRSLPGGIVLLG
jgi:transmembrane sensor